jgi:hypothetical protein
MGNSRNRLNPRNIPGTIRELLKLLCEKKVTIILDAEEEPEHVEIEAVIGDLLVAETNNRDFKFVDIKCICAVIVDREELLEGIFNCDNENENERDNNGKHEDDCHENERRENERHENDKRENEGERFIRIRR